MDCGVLNGIWETLAKTNRFSLCLLPSFSQEPVPSAQHALPVWTSPPQSTSSTQPEPPSLPPLQLCSSRPARLDQVLLVLRACLPVLPLALPVSCPGPVLLYSPLQPRALVSPSLAVAFGTSRLPLPLPPAPLAHHEIPLLFEPFAAKKACASPQISTDFRVNLAFPLETG